MPTIQQLEDALAAAQNALSLIAAPMRPDGTYNRDRKACGTLAHETLRRMDEMLGNGKPAQQGGLFGDSPAQAQPSAAPAGPITIFTDGACKGNPGPSGWGCLIEGLGAPVEARGYLGVTTNNVAELTAALEGLTRVPAGAQVTLFTDSEYVRNGITTWIHGWKKRGWLTADKQPVKNQALWQRLDAARERVTVNWQWVKGHAGNPGNERADQLANLAVAEGR